jgi:hypothetical protein
VSVNQALHMQVMKAVPAGQAVQVPAESAADHVPRRQGVHGAPPAAEVPAKEQQRQANKEQSLRERHTTSSDNRNMTTT